MRRSLAYFLLAALSFWAAAVPVSGQERKDSLVTLVSAKSAQLIEKNGQSFRKVTGPARFLHNNTYLLCDSALWNVTTNIIDAIGHVQIIQDRTRLSSGSLQYVVDDDLAKFRGGLVQLEDTITLLTPTGVVNVKIYKNQYSIYDKQISEYGDDGKKHVVEKSWFSRGSLLMVQGIRRGNDFVPKKTKNSVYPIISKITHIDEDGKLSFQYERKGEDE